MIPKDLLEKYGWRFVPSHDSHIIPNNGAVPECWVHDDYDTLWNEIDVLENINKQSKEALEHLKHV